MGFRHFAMSMDIDGPYSAATDHHLSATCLALPLPMAFRSASECAAAEHDTCHADVLQFGRLSRSA
jgi:hypothetical protein